MKLAELYSVYIAVVFILTCVALTTSYRALGLDFKTDLHYTLTRNSNTPKAPPHTLNGYRLNLLRVLGLLYGVIYRCLTLDAKSNTYMTIKQGD